MEMIKQMSALAAALLLAGCVSVGPDYHRPDEKPLTLQDADAKQESAQDFQANWWKQFNDPTLDALVQRAAKNAPDLKIAIAHLQESRALLGVSRADQWPTVNAAASYTRTRGQVPGVTTKRVTSETYQAGFDASWELDLFGGVRRSVEAAGAQADASSASLQDAQVTLFADVARYYFDLRGTQLRIDVAKRDIDNQRESLRLIQARSDIGTGSEQDVASANARLSFVEAQLPVLETQAHADASHLAVLLGERPGELDIDLSSQNFKAIDVALPIGSAGDVLSRRPDVRVAERELAAANARIGVAKADWFPHITLGGFVGFLAGQSNNFGSPSTRAWSIAPSISWPGLNVQRVRSNVKASEARADAALANYQRTVLQAVEDVSNSLVGFNLQRERVQKLLDQVTQSRRATELARVRYNEGAADFLQLLDAERTQLTAEDSLAEAEAAINLRAVAVYKALGGGWQACGDERCSQIAQVQ
ncbi:efflux transporter outer membrane subunit [Dyella subtropica]|uniref:efflux transporter outer membrane subunit n=1 Tax=Dyella subtropica TaxID=2992127 RepID=UPI00224DEC6D|nr:efflux transporter outer membrane subunit [Dyella subtropica]